MKKERPDFANLLAARAMLHFARDWHFGHLVPAAAANLYARFLYAYSPRLALRYARERSPLFRQCVHALEYVLLPGILLHYAVRKRAVERLVRAGVETGVRQVVVLAAGFDTLATRLHQEYSKVRFIEVDGAGVQAIKRRALGGQIAPNLSFVEGKGMNEALERRLLASVYNSGIPTLFVVEGVLAMMDEAERDTLFDFIGAVSGPGSGVIFTFMERAPDGRIQFRGASWLARLWWRLRAGRLNWGPSTAELEEYLTARGYVLKSVLTAAELRRQCLDGDPDVPLAEGEAVAVAEVIPHKKS